MKRSALTVLGGALAALLSAAAPARADFIQWSYNWTPTVTSIASDTSATSKIMLTNEPGATASGDSDIVATNVTVASDAPRGTPDTFDSNGAWGLRLHLTDTASGQSADLAFGGKFSGTLSGSSANIDSTFSSPLDYLVQLGNNEYHVVIGPYSPPGPPSQSANKGSIAASVEVRAIDIQKAPEPGTLALSCIGLSCLGFVSWRGTRRNSPRA